jgi:alkylation response protein AidB-like acyl-CoA dehydrogenase
MDLSTFEGVMDAAGRDLQSTIFAAMVDEARLMVAMNGTRLTERAITGQVKAAEERFQKLVQVYYQASVPLTADSIIDLRAIAHLAWAVAEKIRQAETQRAQGRTP